MIGNRLARFSISPQSLDLVRRKVDLQEIKSSDIAPEGGVNRKALAQAGAARKTKAMFLAY